MGLVLLPHGGGGEARELWILEVACSSADSGTFESCPHHPEASPDTHLPFLPGFLMRRGENESCELRGLEDPGGSQCCEW